MENELSQRDLDQQTVLPSSGLVQLTVSKTTAELFFSQLIQHFFVDLSQFMGGKIGIKMKRTKMDRMSQILDNINKSEIFKGTTNLEALSELVHSP